MFFTKSVYYVCCECLAKKSKCANKNTYLRKTKCTQSKYIKEKLVK